MSEVKFEYFHYEGGWYWRCKRADGTIICAGGSRYTKDADAKKVISNLIASIRCGNYAVKRLKL